MAWSIPVLDNDILGLKRRLDALRWVRDKKQKKVEDQVKELDSMEKIHHSVSGGIHGDPAWMKVNQD